MAEILATLDDINAELPSDSLLGESATIVATDENTALLQISIARIVRAQLSRVIDNITLAGWVDPTTVPETIRVVAGKLIAAQLYFNQTASQTTEISDTSFAQKRYDEAMAMLTQVIDGQVILPDITPVSDTEALSLLDFFPSDSTDRSFTKSQPF